MNKSSYGPIEYQNLKIPCQEQLNRSINIPQEKSRENLMTPSKLIIGRKANKNLKILLPTNVKLDSKCKTGQATIKEDSSNQFSFSQAALQENSSNARPRKRVRSDKTSEVETADHPSSKCSDLVNNVLEGLAIASEVIDSQNENSDKHKQMKTIKSYLEQYSDIFKTTKNELLHLEAREADDISQLSQFFDRIRKELNSREELLKIKYKSMVNSYQTSLQMDLEFLEQKCQNLCSVIDSYSKKFRTPTKIESNCSEDIMNSYNLESILLKEKVSMNKIESKKFTVQSSDTFQYPDLDCDFRPVRELIAEINVISENSPRLSDTSKMSLPTCTLLAPATEGKIKYLPKFLVKEGRTNRTVGLNNVKQIVEVDDLEASETEDQGMDTSQRNKRKISESSTSSLDSK
ncbi:unnamed protein product [Moneuplotes crassus]|uniref:Uncharacterized protein n=1 Tax=Euplotes crassus TaxID=5936 RepID=A0AAD2DA45_EUPCR|nr:unnamed protein product [Moneuplotes crassus]